MKNARIVVVDDSPFSVALISGILEQNDYEVVGTAGTLEEVIQTVTETKPDLVTMDMTLPETDGLACTRAVHKIDPSIKVIVISSMMDDEIVAQSKKSGVSAYLQKPIDDDELLTAVRRIVETDELYQLLKNAYVEVFKEALKDGINKMFKKLLTYKEEYSSTDDYVADGFTAIIGISGKFSGRMLLGMSSDTAKMLTSLILRRPPSGNEEIKATIAELCNIIAGNACSILNKKDKALGLRVAPPSILSGDKILILPPDFTTVTSVGEADFGDVFLNTGFKRSDDAWM